MADVTVTVSAAGTAVPRMPRRTVEVVTWTSPDGRTTATDDWITPV